MQLVQNIAARITLGKGKYDSATRCLQKLHWLPIQQRIEFKIISLVHMCMHGNAPPYLQRLIHYCNPTRRGLRSEEDTTRLLVPWKIFFLHLNLEKFTKFIIHLFSSTQNCPIFAAPLENVVLYNLGPITMFTLSM